MKRLSPSWFFAILFCSAFLLNFLWESLHGAFLYEGIGALPAERYVSLILYATSVDAVLIVAIYGLVSLVSRNMRWFEEKKKTPLILFILLGLITAVFIEIRAVYFQNRWSYSSLMPMVLGIGLSPLIQLAITGLLATRVTQNIVRK